MALDALRENQFDLGMFQSGVSELEPPGSAEKILGLIGDDGLPFRRGGSVYKSNAATGSGGIKWVKDAVLRAGQRTAWATATNLYTFDTDDTSPYSVAGLSPPDLNRPTKPVVLDGVMYIEPDSSGYETVWGGARRGTYSTGTVTMTAGSRTVTGSGTAWLANAEKGQFLDVSLGGASPSSVIESVDSNTQLTLRWAWVGGVGSGLSYTLAPVIASTMPNPAPCYYGAAQNRIVRTNGQFRVDVTQINNHGAVDPDDYMIFDGAVIGFGTLRDVLLIFTTAGVYAVSNLAYDPLDPLGNPQRRQEIVNADLIAWGRLGIAPFGGALVVPAVDGVYLMDNFGAPTRISDRIQDLYLSYVRTSGYKPGGAEVFAGHYWLPILNSSNNWVDTLVCRLLPTHAGENFAWTQLSGAGAEVSAFTERAGSTPTLLASSTRSTSRILDVSAYINPSAARKNDADGSTHSFQLTTRNIPTGNMVENSVLFIELAYVLTDAATDNPVFTAEVNPDDEGWQTLTGSAPEAGAGSPYVWPCSVAGRHVRFRFTSTLPSAALKVESLSIWLRKSGVYT